MFLGIPDPWVWLAYVLSVLSMIVCVVYGAINWNKGQENLDEEDRSWAEHESEFEEQL